jgi:hypothetical protein
MVMMNETSEAVRKRSKMWEAEAKHRTVALDGRRRSDEKPELLGDSPAFLGTGRRHGLHGAENRQEMERNRESVGVGRNADHARA